VAVFICMSASSNCHVTQSAALRNARLVWALGHLVEQLMQICSLQQQPRIEIVQMKLKQTIEKPSKFIWNYCVPQLALGSFYGANRIAGQKEEDQTSSTRSNLIHWSFTALSATSSLAEKERVLVFSLTCTPRLHAHPTKNIDLESLTFEKITISRILKQIKFRELLIYF